MGILTKQEILNNIKELVYLGQNDEINAERIYQLVSSPSHQTLQTVIRDAREEWMYNQAYQHGLLENLIKIKES